MKISLSDGVHFAEIASAIAVIITLIFVAVQLSQNTSVQREANHQAHMDFARSLADWLRDPTFADTVVRANKSSDNLSEVETLQYGEWLSGRLSLCENFFQQKTRGSLAEELWAPWENYCAHILDGVTAREMWPEIENLFEAEFGAWLNATYAVGTPTP